MRTSHSHTRRRLLAVATSAAVLTVAGCGASGASGTGDTPGTSSSTDAAATTAASSPTAPAPTGANSSASAPASGPSQGAATPVTVPTPVMVKGKAIQYHGQRDVRQDQTTTVEMGDFYFAPSVLIGAPGESLKITLKNTGQAEHNFTFGSDIDADVAAGESMTVTVTFPDSGTAPFICSFHIGAGMAGELAVAPS